MSPPSTSRVELPRSIHAPVPYATALGKAAADREIRVSVILHRKNPLDIASLDGRQLSRDEYAASYGASQEDFDAVQTFAVANALNVDSTMSSLLRRRVELRGTISAFDEVDVTSGTNGEFSAGIGWDPCTGLGTPNGVSLLAALRRAAKS